LAVTQQPIVISVKFCMWKQNSMATEVM